MVPLTGLLLCLTTMAFLIAQGVLDEADNLLLVGGIYSAVLDRAVRSLGGLCEPPSPAAASDRDPA